MIARRGGRVDAIRAGAFRVNPALRPEVLAAVFSRFGRLHIPTFLSEGPDRLHGVLVRPQAWSLSTAGGDGTIDIPADALARADEAYIQALEEAGRAEARRGFHYMYETLRIGAPEVARPVPLLEALLHWLNGDAFLDFVRRVSGEAELVRTDARATRFRPGHYLTSHDDAGGEATRRLAYVLSLTPRWRVDWGGLLAFVDADGHVSEAYTPAYNALNLFRVPQTHLVTPVAPFAGAARLSVTGWIHAA